MSSIRIKLPLGYSIAKKNMADERTQIFSRDYLTHRPTARNQTYWLTVYDSCKWADADSAGTPEKTRSPKMIENGADSHYPIPGALWRGLGAVEDIVFAGYPAQRG